MFFLAGPVFLGAQTPGAAFLSVDPSVRSVALGGVTTAARGAQAVGANPALITPEQDGSEFYASFSQLLEDSTNGHVAVASRYSPITTWALSGTFLGSSGDSVGRDLFGQPTGVDTGSRHVTAAGALSRDFGRGIRGGVAGKMIQSTLAGETSGITWALDAGVAFTVKEVLVSAALNHLGPGIQYIDQRDDLPRQFRLDGAWEPGPLSLMAGYHQSLAGAGSEAMMGFEYRLGVLALRAGLRTSLGGADDLAFNSQGTADQLMDNLTTGFGLKISPRLRMDYAFQQSTSDLGATHSLGLAWTWGNVPRDPSPPAKATSKTTKSPKTSTQIKPPKKAPPKRLKLGE